jgi:hypothetical protein
VQRVSFVDGDVRPMRYQRVMARDCRSFAGLERDADKLLLALRCRGVWGLDLIDCGATEAPERELEVALLSVSRYLANYPGAMDYRGATDIPYILRLFTQRWRGQ